MGSDKYIFSDTAAGGELERLRLIESVFDEKTREWLRSAGSLAGRHCLEVGAGAGSIAEWMAAEVGADGRVVVVEPDTRFVAELGSRIEIVEGRLDEVSAPTESFDLVHARYVLIHNVDARAVLDEMVRSLKSGAALVLEEPDFSAAAPLSGPPQLKQAFENVKRALIAMFASREMSYSFGRLLPELVQSTGLDVVAVEYDAAVGRGGSPLAEMMRRSTLALADKYIATGHATAADIADYSRLATLPDCWAIYYATVRVLARKQR